MARWEMPGYHPSVTCCLDCKDRHQGCHDTCWRYNKEHAMDRARKRQLKEQRQQGWDDVHAIWKDLNAEGRWKHR